MRLQIRVDPTEINSLLALLKAYPRRTTKKHFRAAIQAGAVVLAKNVRAAAPGKLKKGVKAERATPASPFAARSVINSYSPLSHLLEEGFNIVKKDFYAKKIKRRRRLTSSTEGPLARFQNKTTRRGIKQVKRASVPASRGGTKGKWPVLKAVSPKPFMLPAMERSISSMQRAIEDRLRLGILKEQGGE